MKSNFFVLTLCLALGFVIISCGDDDIAESQSFPISTDVEVQMRVGDETLLEGNTYTINETAIQIETARFYLGNISLTNTIDTIPIEFNTYRIISPDNNRFSLGVLETDSYGVSFGIGVDPQNNDQTTEDFASRPASDPLGAQEPAMHWNWNSGYKFLRIDGIVDTDNDGEVDTPVQYHIGGDVYFTILSAINSVDISADNDEFVLRFDLAELLSNTDINLANSSTGMVNTDIIDPIFNNYEQAFSIRN